jgi:hypothetical protein
MKMTMDSLVYAYPFLGVVWADRVHIYLPQVWERGGWMQTLGRAAR